MVVTRNRSPRRYHAIRIWHQTCARAGLQAGHSRQVGDRELIACPDWVYNNRNIVDRLWAKLKEWRAVATYYEKTAASFLGILLLVATILWIRG